MDLHKQPSRSIPMLLVEVDCPDGWIADFSPDTRIDLDRSLHGKGYLYENNQRVNNDKRNTFVNIWLRMNGRFVKTKVKLLMCDSLDFTLRCMNTKAQLLRNSVP